MRLFYLIGCCVFGLGFYGAVMAAAFAHAWVIPAIIVSAVGGLMIAISPRGGDHD